MIKIIIDILLLILLIFLLIRNMYLFQLNSYKPLHHIKRIIENKGMFNFKNKKIKFSLTHRVERMFLTEFIFIAAILVGTYFLNKELILIELIILNIVSPIICIFANFVNKPVEAWRRNHYIKLAKNKLKEMPNLKVIGITGSYGKTSTKKYLAEILKKKYEVLVTPENYNTLMGVVKTINGRLKATDQIFICEMGATKQGDIKEICDLVKPTIGIITAIGPQHLESFKSIENIIDTKFELADEVKQNNGVMFLNYDNEYLRKRKSKQEIIFYGKDIPKYNTKLVGKHNLINVDGAVKVAKFLGMNDREIKQQVAKLSNVEHRLELIKRGNMDILDDSYNSNPVSSKYAIDTLNEFKGTKIIVTPGLIELGKDEKKYNEELGSYAEKYCDYIYLVNSTKSQFVENGIKNKEKIVKVNSPQEAIQKITAMNYKKVCVLLENDLPDNY